MAKDFPLVGVISPNYLYRSMVAPALALGIDLRLLGTQMSSIANKLPGCDLVTVLGTDFPISTMRTLESESVVFRPSSQLVSEAARRNSTLRDGNAPNSSIVVAVARSPHAQVASWSPTQIVYRNDLHRLSISPAQGVSEENLSKLSLQALKLAGEIELVGVGNFIFENKPDGFELRGISLGPSEFFNWTVDASITSQYEQHLRSILDLPLGDPQIKVDVAVSGNYLSENERNMYRPYLHLMARSPQMKFHQFRDGDATFGGFINSTGNNLLDLTEGMWHALDYMDGDINE